MQVVTPKSWRDLEKQLILEGTFKKGGFMDIREEIKERGRLEGIEQGMQKGMQAGRLEGIEQGMQKGMQAGRLEGMQAVVLNMLKKSANMAFISEVTGLTEDEINQLKNGS